MDPKLGLDLIHKVLVRAYEDDALSEPGSHDQYSIESLSAPGTPRIGTDSELKEDPEMTKVHREAELE